MAKTINVVIDAGHGGTGYMGRFQQNELKKKDITLTIAVNRLD